MRAGGGGVKAGGGGVRGGWIGGGGGMERDGEGFVGGWTAGWVEKLSEREKGRGKERREGGRVELGERGRSDKSRDGAAYE